MDVDRGERKKVCVEQLVFSSFSNFSDRQIRPKIIRPNFEGSYSSIFMCVFLHFRVDCLIRVVLPPFLLTLDFFSSFCESPANEALTFLTFTPNEIRDLPLRFLLSRFRNVTLLAFFACDIFLFVFIS